jgi:glycosyltransferase involved in cell wall biosynthesis
MSLTIGVILPHTKIFGGVKRFLEIGNILVDKGHRFIIFTPEGAAPSWFTFRGEIKTLIELQHVSFDALFATEMEYLNDLKTANAQIRIYYAVLERRQIKKVLKEKDIHIFANSTKLYNYLGGDSNPRLVKAIGGIDLQKFAFRRKPEATKNDAFVVMVYGRFYRKKKGTLLVVRACERLFRKGYNIKLQLFDSPIDEVSRKKVRNFKTTVPFEFFVDYPVQQIANLYYKADVFISAERNAGWCNTGAEAMACGTPLIATTSGTTDFLIDNKTGIVVWRFSYFIERAIKKVYEDAAFRNAMLVPARKKIEEFSWERLSSTIEEYIVKNLDIRNADSRAS